MELPISPRGLALRATPFLCLLFLTTLYIFYVGTRVFPSNQLKKTHPVLESRTEDQHHLHLLLKRLVEGENQTQLEATGFSCHSNIQTEVCVFSRPVTIDTSTMTIYAPFSRGMLQANRTITPYARKGDKFAMEGVSQVQILQGNITTAPPVCRYNHKVPVLVFSSGGFTGNMYHEYNEVIIPLFLTSRHFQSRLRFIITNYRPSFVSRHDTIISHLSSYEVINPTQNGSSHCFPGAVVGLHYHDILAINSTVIPQGYSMLDFKQFLRESYNLKVRDLSQTEKPGLLLVSRQTSRMFLNEDQMVTMMEALGFRVVVAKPDMMADTENFAEIVNSCKVMVGSHGAGLTNMVFLPPGAVMVQVIGLGLDWASNHYFGTPAIGMGLNYIPYKIEAEESSLVSVYGRDHPVVVDPISIATKGYEFERAYYLIEQNFNIDVVRFSKTLVQALGFVGRSAPLG